MGQSDRWDRYPCLKGSREWIRFVSLDGIIRGLCSLVESKSKNRNKVKKRTKRRKKVSIEFSFFQNLFSNMWLELSSDMDDKTFVYFTKLKSSNKNWGQRGARELSIIFLVGERKEALRGNGIVILWGLICVVKLKWNKEL